ncbi:MAG TPA: phosphatase PAP2 family protein [Candidatus Tectomicrobia bacterium]|nr:phosphatase PAP2 family protein [Candidatus Tectomicrobia bacterium]
MITALPGACLRPPLAVAAVAGGLLLVVSAAVLAGLTAVDTRLLGALNAFAQRVPDLDRALWHVANANVLKGGVFAAALCWAWYRPEPSGRARRAVITAIAAGYVALVVTQVLAVVLPVRPRPMHTVAFTVPAGVNENVLRGWSSFPSDHAALFFALAAGLCLASWRLGSWLVAYAVILVGLIRVYLGLHHPSDILAGALIGTLAAMVAGQCEWLHSRLLATERRHPALFYTVGFALLYQIATLFDGPQQFARVALRVANRWVP